MKKLFLITFLISFVFSAYGQRNPNSEYWNTFHYKAKEGNEQKFIQAAAIKTKKFNANPENLIVTYRITTGENAGVYERIMPFQSSKRYDRDASKELKYWAENVAPYASPVGGQQIWVRLKWADVNIDPNDPPFKHLLKTTYIVKPTHQNHFGTFMARIGKIMAKRMPDAGRLVLRLFSGGQRNMFVSYIAFDTFEHNNPKFDSTWEDDYNEIFGWDSWNTDTKLFDESLEMIVGEQRVSLELVEELLPN
ncbi:MAG: hypothetical protein P8L83_00740 [Flavobacteriaceae bacterium]|nr:hypothetical protein [Flavobacteriaceae bacterium]